MRRRLVARAELSGVEAAVQGRAFADAGRAEDADGGDRVDVHVHVGSEFAASCEYSAPDDRIGGDQSGCVARVPGLQSRCGAAIPLVKNWPNYSTNNCFQLNIRNISLIKKYWPNIL